MNTEGKFNIEFIPFDKEILYKFKLTIAETLVYGCIKLIVNFKNDNNKYGINNVCFLSSKDIGKYCQIKPKTVNDIIRKLIDKELIEKDINDISINGILHKNKRLLYLFGKKPNKYISLVDRYIEKSIFRFDKDSKVEGLLGLLINRELINIDELDSFLLSHGFESYEQSRIVYTGEDIRESIFEYYGIHDIEYFEYEYEDEID